MSATTLVARLQLVRSRSPRPCAPDYHGTCKSFCRSAMCVRTQILMLQQSTRRVEMMDRPDNQAFYRSATDVSTQPYAGGVGIVVFMGSIRDRYQILSF